MTKKNTGYLGLVAVATGLLGLTLTGCGLDTNSQIVAPPDSMEHDPPVENVVPIDQAQVELIPGR